MDLRGGVEDREAVVRSRSDDENDDEGDDELSLLSMDETGDSNVDTVSASSAIAASFSLHGETGAGIIITFIVQ